MSLTKSFNDNTDEMMMLTIMDLKMKTFYLFYVAEKCNFLFVLTTKWIRNLQRIKFIQ